MSDTMIADLSNNEILILQTLWEQKALGTRGVTIHDLLTRLSDLPKTEAAEKLKRLENRGLVTIANVRGGDRFALSPLGAAFVRQLQDRKLGDLTRAP